MSNPGNMTYDESDHPRMGVVRRASEKNELLVKPKLATVKRPTRDIPEESFSYGIIYERGGGVEEAMLHREHVANPHATKGNDIRAMNKAAPRITYRKEYPLKLKVKKRIANVPPLPSKTNPDHVYGKPLLRGETTDELMSYSYADDWINMNRHHQHNYQFIKPQFIPPKTTRAVDVRSDCCYQRYNPPEEKERFVMSKFRKVPHRIDNVQTTPLLRDERPPVFKSMKKRGGICDAQTAYCGDGDDYPSCGIAGVRTRLPCSGMSPGMSTLLPRRSDSDMICVPAAEGAADRKVLLPRFYKPCSSNPAPDNPSGSCATHPRRSDPSDGQAVAPVAREMVLRGPRRSDPD